jgi:hypothetical protein
MAGGALHDDLGGLVAVGVARDDGRSLGVGEVLVAPLQQSEDHQAQVGAALGQLVLVALAAAWIAVRDALQDVGFDESAER